MYKLHTFVALFLFVFFGCQSHQKKDTKPVKKENHINSLKTHLQEKFTIDKLIDTAGKAFQINYSTADLTIIDFWMNECPPCNAEMAQFKSLLKGKEQKVQIISISINNFPFWKKLFTEDNPRYRFLKDTATNWKQAALQSSDKYAFKNIIGLDRYDEIKAKLDVTYFPSYFVLDKDATILERPESAVDYLKELE